jgi:hypothetical protein
MLLLYCSPFLRVSVFQLVFLLSQKLHCCFCVHTMLQLHQHFWWERWVFVH